MILRNTLTATLALVTLAILPSEVLADGGEEWVTASGEAAIVNDNEIEAKASAKDQALRNAVEQVAGTLVSAISETKDWMSVRDEITSQGAGFVKKYESPTYKCGGGTCTASVKALVAKGLLSKRLDQLGLLIQKMRYPRVLLMVSEVNEGSGASGQWWGGDGGGARSQVFENTFIEYLNKTWASGRKVAGKRGRSKKCETPTTDRKFRACWDPIPHALRFRFVDYSPLLGHPLVKKASEKMVDDDAVAAIAKLTDAEIVIVGRAHAKSSGKVLDKDDVHQELDMHSINASVSLRVVDVNSGAVLATASAESLQIHISRSTGGDWALRNVAAAIVPDLQAKIADAWQAASSGTRWVKVEVNGVKSYGDLTRFKGLLQHGITGVKAVHQRKMEGTFALLELQSTRTTEELASELSGKTVGKYSVTIVKVMPGVLGIRLGK